jgi:DNA-binding CsgD family transcriptional regulator
MLRAVDLLEVAYRSTPDDASWMRDVLRSFPLLAADRIGVGYQVDLSRHAQPKISGHLSTDPGAFDSSGIAAGHQLLLGGDLSRLYKRRLTSVRSTFKASHPLIAEFLEPQGIKDAAALVALDASRVGVAFAITSPSRIMFSAQERRSYERIASHLSTAWRLHKARKLGGSLDGADAIFDPDGRVLSAENDAKGPASRQRLRDFALRVERVRSRKNRGDSDAALEAWTALVDGRWSLVEHFDTDGRRFCVFVRNETQLGSLKALDSTERQTVALAAMALPNKLIAYELGVSEARVVASLRGGMRKLGVGKRSDLIQVLGALSAAARASG